MIKHNEEEKEGNSERWALTYSDMITLLLVLFIMLYTMSSIDSKKYEELAKQLGNTLGSGQAAGGGNGNGNGTGAGSSAGEVPVVTTVTASQQFDELYYLLKERIDDKGYGDKIVIEKGETYIHFRFKDNILFFSDSDQMKQEGNNILQIVSEALLNANKLITTIQIEGHTAEDNPDDPNNLFAWRLSSNRAISVLDYMVTAGGLPQSKMTIAGYSHFRPISDDKSEAGLALNRRVEVTITRILDANEAYPSSSIITTNSDGTVSTASIVNSISSSSSLSNSSKPNSSLASSASSNSSSKVSSNSISSSKASSNSISSSKASSSSVSSKSVG